MCIYYLQNKKVEKSKTIIVIDLTKKTIQLLYTHKRKASHTIKRNKTYLQSTFIHSNEYKLLNRETVYKRLLKANLQDYLPPVQLALFSQKTLNF